MEKNQNGLAAWSESRSPEYEAKAIGRVCAMARKHGCILYFVHIGSAAALEKIRTERSLGTKIFVETCPHYLELSSATKRGNSKANSSHNTSKSNSGSDSRTSRRFGRYIGS